MTVWLFGDSIFRGAAIGRFPEDYAPEEAAAEPLWPMRSPAAVMNLLLSEDVVAFGGVTGLPDGVDKAVRELSERLRAGAIGPADTLVFLDVGHHAEDPDVHEAQWRALLRQAAVAEHPVRLIMCGGFDNGPRGRAACMHDRPIGGRSANDAVRAAAAAPGGDRGDTRFLALAAPLRAYHHRLKVALRRGGLSPRRRPSQHLGAAEALRPDYRRRPARRAAQPGRPRVLPRRTLGGHGRAIPRGGHGHGRPGAAGRRRGRRGRGAGPRRGRRPMSGGFTLSFAEARRRLKQNPQARWRNIAVGFEGEVWPEISPSFQLKPGDVVFTIGSCFAREIEQHLTALGCRAPMTDLRLPPQEWGGAANGAMNKFHPPSFRSPWPGPPPSTTAAARSSGPTAPPLAFDSGDGRLFDLDMAAIAPVTRERFLERRQHIYDIFAQAFSADCLMMTPGLVEAWRDRTTGLYIHETPVQRAMAAQPERWELEVLSYEACLADMLAALDVVRARNPGVKVLVTTSPVPMSATFSGEDVRIANAYSKSVLRAVCGAGRQEPRRGRLFPQL